MRLLLDTHIWVWTQLEPDKLTGHVLEELKNKNNEIWLSPISVWELLHLVRKRRISLDQEVYEWIDNVLTTDALKEAPLTTEVVLAMREIQLPHRDPADLFLAATAKAFDLTLVTADARLLAVPGLLTLANG